MIYALSEQHAIRVRELVTCVKTMGDHQLVWKGIDEGSLW